MQSDFLIIEPFNAMFWVLMAITVIMIIAIAKIFKNKDERTKEIFFYILCGLNIIGYFVYKHYLSIDAEYDVLRGDYGGFSWWGELPLQLCNINMLLMPLAVARKDKGLLGFCFFVAPLGAALAILMPAIGFEGYSILLPRMLGFYGTHLLIVVEAISLMTLGFYYPDIKTMPQIISRMLIVSVCVFAFNLFLIHTGLYPQANYFYMMDPEGNSVLEMFKSWIPYPFLYCLPGLVVLIVYMIVVCFVVSLFGKRNK